MAYGEVEYRDKPRRRWGRRLLITLLVLLIVLAGLLVVADRVGASVAERRIGEEVSQELTNRGVRSSVPEVTVGGFPFLTQVLAEEYESISIRLRDVEPEEGQPGVRLPRLDVEARDVRAPIDAIRSGQGAIVAGEVTGDGTIAYASVVELMDQEGLRLSERSGKLVAELPLEFFGQRFTLAGEAAIEATDEGQIRLRFEKLDAEGLPSNQAVRSTINAQAERISIVLPLPPLPWGIELREVRALPEGLAVTATASEVPLNAAVG